MYFCLRRSKGLAHLIHEMSKLFLSSAVASHLNSRPEVPYLSIPSLYTAFAAEQLPLSS